jgi:hypothetical protein
LEDEPKEEEEQEDLPCGTMLTPQRTQLQFCKLTKVQAQFVKEWEEHVSFLNKEMLALQALVCILQKLKEEF